MTTIRTYYYKFHFQTGDIEKIPVTIVDKQLMPNVEYRKIKSLLDMHKIGRKTDYDIQWLYPSDHDYKRGHDIKITFRLDDATQTSDYNLHLSWWQRRQMKIIWGKYWLVRGDNFRNYIFPFIIALFVAIATVFIKDYVDRHHQRDTDNRGEQPVK